MMEMFLLARILVWVTMEAPPATDWARVRLSSFSANYSYHL